MSSNNDSISKTLIVVVSLCLVCAIVVATAAVQLRPTQQANKKLDSQINILRSVGLIEGSAPAAKVAELFSKHVETRLVNLKTGEIDASCDTACAEAYDYRKNLKEGEALAQSEDVASIRRISEQAPIWLTYDDNRNLKAVVLPVHGYGLWSTMHAFLAVETDGNTIIGLNYYEQGETPGLGGEIENPRWKAQFTGKKLTNDAGQLALTILKPGNADPQSDYQVDGLSGATLTANGVQNTFTFWIGENGFGPFLTKVRQGALTNG
ncbi:Na(+)-translocating NADH-quinone reductase subunit C [Alishewanella sp. 16-MA]|uniref:Na(+)-translocating NADH-quinone reductase subunit C n=1 Tax=Alishewanella maricola TaxID=2795740 RepID=A0ABS8BZI6_9ALTE|nr:MULTISPECIES: Na(+)-translocating NADH-quinone reductase subunit C [Alishewanella]MDP4946028.1 Na(+)-translocating NADH-quinone reductase subunit C [Alishewanella sp.]MDP5205690.1 Na(+)-translocating NADH-quinone reductase subunit C [Alishewanella sp. SMS9]MCB5225482.1 Na(+)-translocating NADH-quinone reductase subunit C [Alishewanella maricola]MDP5035128.1 Na(+)-translocating NADH-quinone reductase subunit C [Alishewanella sp.]MDP5188050.1 Na(+)-translocating NADH-quinone reductase subunit